MAMTISSFGNYMDNGFVYTYQKWPWRCRLWGYLRIMKLCLATATHNFKWWKLHILAGNLVWMTMTMTMPSFIVDTYILRTATTMPSFRISMDNVLYTPTMARAMSLLKISNDHCSYIPTMGMTMSSFRISMKNGFVFHPLEILSRSSETQFQVGENHSY